MKVIKRHKITNLKATFNRGYVQADADNQFAELYIAAFKEFVEEGDYCYWNWHIRDLKDLADAIYGFLKEHPEGKKLLAKGEDNG